MCIRAMEKRSMSYRGEKKEGTRDGKGVGEDDKESG
jgi:hypothetical protein